MRGIVVSILLFLFLSPSTTFAKNFKIESKDVNRIDIALDLVETWGNLVLPDEFKRVLNITVQSTEAGTDITYGLLVLSAVNEMEMIDMVISQRYKQKATEYFSNILNQQIGLIGYYKGVGFDISRILIAKNIGGPISALTLNTFDITNKVIVALLAIQNLKQINHYDGVWRYFDGRRNGSLHPEAWSDARVEMGYDPTAYSKFHNFKNEAHDDIAKLEPQFKDLWEKWGPNTNAFGVKDEVKRQFNEEMRSIVREAADAYIAANAQQKTELGFVQNIQKRLALFGDFVKQKVSWLTEKTKEFANKIGSFIASLTTRDIGAGLVITILEDKTVVEESISRKTDTPEPKLEETESSLSPTKEKEEILSRTKEEPEQRNLQILIPRMLAQEREKQQREKEQSAKNLVGLSFEGCRNGQININTADVKLLDELVGIGPAKAQSIIDYRTQREQFFVVNDLSKVSGIGEATLAKIKEQNLACAGNPDSTSFIPFQKTAASQNSGAPPPAPGGTAGTPTFLKILITEVQTAGTSSQTEEFIELYNPNDSKIELHDWYLQKKTQSASEFSSFASKTLFEGEKISAYGYFLIARQGSSFESSADIIVTSSLADNNTLALKNPNGETADKVGWGSVADSEIAPAQNPVAGKSLSRKYDTSYQDTDNNSQDFEEKTPTPKAINQVSSSSGSSSDTTPPTVVFNALSTTQTTAFFSLGWTGTNANQYFLTYTTTPSTDGILQYATTGTWQSWQPGTAGEITLASTVSVVSLTTQDGIEYTFSIKAEDTAGNESSTASSTTNVSLEKNIVINEIAWAGTKASSSDEWIELYNNTASSVDLTGWTLQSSDSDGPNIELSGSIGANSFYLIERTNDNPTTETANLTGSFGIGGLSNTTCEVLYLYDSSGNTADQTFCKSDGTWPGGGASPDYIALERVNPQASGAESTNWAANNLIAFNGKDTANNWINGTPKATNSVSQSETEITNLRFDEFSTLTLTLLGQPYYTNGQVTVPSGKTLAIEPGVTLKLKGGVTKLEVSGTLSAAGTSSKNIILTTYETSGSSNIWCGLHFTSTSQNSNLQYVTVEKAGSTTSGCGSGNPQYSVFVENSSITLKNSTITGGNGYKKLYLKNSNSTIDALTVSGALIAVDSAAIYIDGGSPTIANSTFSDNTDIITGIGIWNTSSSGTPTISNNTFTSYIYPIKLTGGSATLSGNSASGNTYNAIFVEGSASTNITWAKDNIPYLMDTLTVNAGKTLTIQAGVTIKLASIASGARELTVSGNLVTQGTASQLVIFTPLASGGNWRRIQLVSGSTANLQYTKIEYGGNTNFQGALYIKEATLELSNVEIKNSANSAIYGFNATISGSNLTLTDNTYGFLIQTGDCPSFTNTPVITGGNSFHTSSVSCTF